MDYTTPNQDLAALPASMRGRGADTSFEITTNCGTGDASTSPPFDPSYDETSQGLVIKAALEYIEHGWSPIPIPVCRDRKSNDGKNPRYHDWQSLVIDASQVEKYFSLTQLRRCRGIWVRAKTVNIGILLGAPSQHLVDVDLDCDEAIRLAPLFLPPTPMMSGRSSKPRSHFWYVSPGLSYTMYEDPASPHTLLELRQDGHQTIVPPSLHRTGEQYIWFGKLKPAHVSSVKLISDIGQLAAACLIARQWPTEAGHRQDLALALGGALAHAGCDEALVLRVVGSVCDVVGDEEKRERLDAVCRSFAKLRSGDMVTGIPTLNKQWGQKTVDSLLQWLGVDKLCSAADGGWLVNHEFLDYADRSSTKPTGSGSLPEYLLMHARAAVSELYCDMEGQPYARIKEKHQPFDFPIRSEDFSGWLRVSFFDEHHRLAGKAAIEQVQSVLEFDARKSGRRYEMSVRVAGDLKRIHIDLGDADRNIVSITPESIEITRDCPARFRRSGGAGTLPLPDLNGNVEELREFFTGDDDSFRLLTAFILACLAPLGSYPVLVLHGEQGSAKSSTARMVQRLVDPKAADLRPLPSNDDQLQVAARWGRVLAFDNISSLTEQQSDALCRLTSGSGRSTRRLYTDADESVIATTRPLILTGISSFVTRGDLRDRCVFIRLGYLPDSRRMPDEELWNQFDRARPRIFGGLCRMLQMALRNHAGTPSTGYSRLAGFERLLVAAEGAQSASESSTVRIFRLNRQDASTLHLDSEPVFHGILKFLADTGTWCGTASDLLLSLKDLHSHKVLSGALPSSPESMSRHLARLEPDLRAAGISVAHRKTGNHRLIQLRLGNVENGT